MKTVFDKISVFAQGGASDAADIFIEEIASRGVPCGRADSRETADVIFECVPMKDKDCFRISEDGEKHVFAASGIRGLLYAAGLFLRKTEYNNGEARLVRDIRGDHAPKKPIRGHQLGYRPTANSYEAWDEAQYRRYYLDMMYFGANTVEHLPECAGDTRNRLMKYSSEEMCAAASGIADGLDLDVSLWMPNYEETDAEAVINAQRVFAATPRIDAVFIPGSDPGDLPADALFRRAGKIYQSLIKYHPQTKIWISAQAPHDTPEWGDAFIKEIEKRPDFVGGVIQGPNRAMELDELRRRVPGKYPIRLYPDITHNVRCEYPVHFPTDDWHYAWAATLSRESVDPRAKEMRRIHRLTRQYVVGSVSYSEGINDDFNKMIWSCMDWYGEVDLRECALDYARLFFPGGDAETLADALFGLEENWESAPEESVSVEPTLRGWLKAGEADPALYGNWRYLMHLFRAECDAIVRRKRIFEANLISRARELLIAGDIDESEAALRSAPPGDIKKLRHDLEEHGKRLFEMIGMQLDVDRYCANSWERGAVLDTIDNPVTNREYLLSRFALAPQDPTEKRAYLLSAFDRTRVTDDEFYYSVAEQGLECCGCAQEWYPYMNFRGDDPNRRGTMPMEITKVFDNYSFRLNTGGFDPKSDYIMRVVYFDKKKDAVTHHKIRINDAVIYEGPQFGQSDPYYDKKYLPEGFVSAVYDVPGSVFKGGSARIVLSEPTMGVMFSEIFITKKA